LDEIAPFFHTLTLRSRQHESLLQRDFGIQKQMQYESTLLQSDVGIGVKDIGQNTKLTSTASLNTPSAMGNITKNGNDNNKIKSLLLSDQVRDDRNKEDVEENKTQQTPESLPIDDNLLSKKDPTKDPTKDPKNPPQPEEKHFSHKFLPFFPIEVAGHDNFMPKYYLYKLPNPPPDPPDQSDETNLKVVRENAQSIHKQTNLAQHFTQKNSNPAPNMTSLALEDASYDDDDFGPDGKLTYDGYMKKKLQNDISQHFMDFFRHFLQYSNNNYNNYGYPNQKATFASLIPFQPASAMGLNSPTSLASGSGGGSGSYPSNNHNNPILLPSNPLQSSLQYPVSPLNQSQIVAYGVGTTSGVESYYTNQLSMRHGSQHGYGYGYGNNSIVGQGDGGASGGGSAGMGTYQKPGLYDDGGNVGGNAGGNEGVGNVDGNQLAGKKSNNSNSGGFKNHFNFGFGKEKGDENGNFGRNSGNSNHSNNTSNNNIQNGTFFLQTPTNNNVNNFFHINNNNSQNNNNNTHNNISSSLNSPKKNQLEHLQQIQHYSQPNRSNRLTSFADFSTLGTNNNGILSNFINTNNFNNFNHFPTQNQNHNNNHNLPSQIPPPNFDTQSLPLSLQANSIPNTTPNQDTQNGQTRLTIHLPRFPIIPGSGLNSLNNIWNIPSHLQ
jgi:hypothetical protein